MNKVKRIKIMRSQVALQIAVFILCALVVYPFLTLIIKSFKDYEQEVYSPITFTFPLHFDKLNG